MSLLLFLMHPSNLFRRDLPVENATQCHQGWGGLKRIPPRDGGVQQQHMWIQKQNPNCAGQLKKIGAVIIYFCFFTMSVKMCGFPSGGQTRKSTAVPSVPAEEDERPAGQHSGRIWEDSVPRHQWGVREGDLPPRVQQELLWKERYFITASLMFTVLPLSDVFFPLSATSYGQGVYFAVKSAISLNSRYSPPNADGHKFVFVSRVLTGDYTKGCSWMKAAPLKESSDTTSVPFRYDSVTDNMDNPEIFVIFNDTQAFPQYLITCKTIRFPNSVNSKT